jgi:hypothetical protein
MAVKRSGVSGDAWHETFERYRILDKVAEQGFADITADEMRVFREPRLMSKIDHEQQLPEIFRENKLSILTLSRKAFRIGKFDIFQNLPEWQLPGKDVETLPFPANLETLDFNNITGEPGVINTAYATEMLHNFTEQELVLTVSGRMTSGDFDYSVDTFDAQPQQIHVSKAQIEIDAAYEGDKGFYIFEVKNHMSKDFNMRQLYYPFRTWQERIKKPTNTVFLTLSNDVFDLYQYQFENVKDFSSGNLVKHKRYMLSHSDPKAVDLVQEAKKSVGAKPRTKETFPQANDFARVVDLVSFLLESPRSVDDLTNNYAFDPRQSDYYYVAARDLGLATSVKGADNVEYRQATPLAAEIFAKGYKEKFQALAELLLGIDTVAQLYLNTMTTGSLPSSEEATQILANSPDSQGISGNTIERRAQTALSWTKWLQAIAS